MPLSITSAPRQLSDGNSAGTVLGQATNNAGLPDNIAFNGGSPAPFLLQGTLRGTYGFMTTNVSTASPSSVTANTTSEKSFTVSGVAAGDMVVAAIKPTSQAGLMVGTARVSASNTIQLSMGNATAGALTPTTTEIYQFLTVPAALTFSATLTPASVASNTTVEQQFTVAGVQAGMAMWVSKPTLQAGLLVTQARAIAANTVGITFVNVTGSAATPTAAESYLFFASQGMRVVPAMQIYTPSLTPVSVAANTSAEQTFTVAGLSFETGPTTLVNQPYVVVNKPSIQAGLTICGARVSAINQLAINFANTTGSAITPNAAETYTVMVFPPAPGTSVAVQTTAVVMSLDASNEIMRMGW